MTGNKKLNVAADRVCSREVWPKLLVIVPVYNEAPNLGKLVTQLKQTELPVPADVLFVNDGSTDGSVRFLREGLNHVTSPFNMGYGSCLQIGYKYAVRRNYTWVIQMDADGQHDVCNIPKLYEALCRKMPDGKYPDIVLGSRFMPGSTPFPAGPLKKLGYAWERFLVRLVTGRRARLWDPTTGLQGLSRSAFLYYSVYGNFDILFPDVNMVAQMQLSGFRICQIPAAMHQREGGVSMHTGLLRQGVYMIHMTMSVLAVGLRYRGQKETRRTFEKEIERKSL